MRHSIPLLLLFIGALEAVTCPNGTIQLGDENKCAYLGRKAMHEVDAVRDCLRMGGDLVKILNTFENSVIYGYVKAATSEDPFLGIERKANGEWAYTDGSPLKFANWAPGQPDNSSNECTVMDMTNSKWKTADCGTPKIYVCGIDGQQQPSTWSTPMTTPTLRTTPPPSQCPSGWIYNPSLNYCYFLQSFNYTMDKKWVLYNWTVAESACMAMNGHLVSIHSQAEKDYVNTLVYANTGNMTNVAPQNKTCDTSYAWIGLNGNGLAGNGYWTDSTPVDFSISDIGRTSNPWQAINDPNCFNYLWVPYYSYDLIARYVCKQPSRNRLMMEMEERSHRIYLTKTKF